MFPAEIYEHILSFLPLKEKSKCKQISKLWYDIVFQWKDAILREMKKHYRKYVRIGNIGYFDSVPLSAQYYLLQWSVDYINEANQEENIVFAITNHYDYYQPKLKSAIIPLMRENQIIDEYFSRTESLKWELLALAIETEDMNLISFMLNKITMVKEHSVDNGRKFYKLLFTKHKRVIDAVLAHFHKIKIIKLYQTSLIIQYAVRNNHLEYVEKYYHGEECRSAIIKGIVKNPDEEIYQKCLAYVDYSHFSGNYWSSDNIRFGIIQDKSTQFFIQILNALSLNYEQIRTVYFNILSRNQENMHLIQVITDYFIKRYCKGLYSMKELINGKQFKTVNLPFEDKISKMICQFSVPIIKHLLELGYEPSRENLTKIINSNRIDILELLNSVDNQQLTDYMFSIATSGKLYSINLDTFIWLCDHCKIPKSINVTYQLIMNYDPANELGLVNYLYKAGFRFDGSFYEKIIRDPVHRSLTEWKVNMCEFIYQRGYRFDSNIIGSVFEPGIGFNGHGNAIILKWFVKHGLMMTPRMIYINDIIRIKWMIKHGCSYNKKWFQYKIDQMRYFVSDNLAEYVSSLS